MANLIKETKNKISRIEEELKEIAVKLDLERKESASEDDTNIKTELLDKKAYLEGQLSLLRSSLVDMTTSKSTRGAMDLGVEAVIDMNGQKRNMTVVSSAHADPTKGLISSESPMGQALLGKKAGESIKITTPAGDREFSILEILSTSA